MIHITKFKGAVAIENLLQPYKRGEAKITPEVCREVLLSTNFKRNIRDMLSCILKLAPEEQIAFKGVIMDTFSNREQPDDVQVLGKKLAAFSGYEGELGSLAGKIMDGSYLKSASNVDLWEATSQENYEEKDLSEYSKMKFLGKYANLNMADNLPDIDVSCCDKVDLFNCDLKNVTKLTFKDRAAVSLPCAIHLPEDLDVSMCSEVDLSYCDLAAVKKLRFRNQAQLNESHAEISEKWDGKLIFADEENTIPKNTDTLQRIAGIAAAKCKSRR